MENAVKFIIGIGGGIASFLFGGWSALIQTLLFFIILDYVFAVLVAISYGEVSSKKGFRGIAKKVAILIVVAVAHRLDLVLADVNILDGNLIRDTVIFFYLANETFSIIETASKTNLPIPGVLRKAVGALNQKGGEQND